MFGKNIQNQFFIVLNFVMNLLVINVFFCISTEATAKIGQILSKIELTDQFDQKVQVNEQTKWIVFSGDKYSSDLIQKAIEDLKLTDLSIYKGIYVADISAMPGMVTAMFALPKMKKYSFKVTLDKSGDFTEKWPRKKEMVTLLQLDQLKIISEVQTIQFDVIKKFIAENSKVNL